MHRIIKAHLASYVQSQGLAGDEESEQFEKFVNYSVLSNCCPTSFDIDDVTTGPGDDGCDGIAVVIDEEIISSSDFAEEIFKKPRRNHEVNIVFIQTKRSEGFDLGDFLKFKESVLRFCVPGSYRSRDDVMSLAHEVFDIVLREVPKVRNGQPNITVRYVTTGVYAAPEALETARRDFCRQLEELGLFLDINVQFVDRAELTKLWVSTYSGVQCTVDLFSYAPLPTISGINQAYLAVLKAKDFVEALLSSPDGNLRTQVFEENVRSFLGIENPVNQSIADTLRSGDNASRFAVLNNGITVVSPELSVRGNILRLRDYQIVNGCQTSNVLYECRDILSYTMVNIKVVETKNEDVFTDLVRATNSQTKVDDIQFLSLRPINRKIEQYFQTFEGDARLYFERRDRQYAGMSIPGIKIFSMNNAARCVAAMFCNRPDLAARYPKTMYDELTNVIFADDNKEIVFYAACLSMWRFVNTRGNKLIPQNVNRYKWHILAIVRSIVCGRAMSPLNSKSIENCCESIVELMAKPSDAVNEIFQRAVDICQSLGDVSRDRLKRQAILTEMLARI